MVNTAEETEAKVTIEGAQIFIDWFYAAINDRKPLASFYVTSNGRYTAVGTTATLTINGRACAGGVGEFETLLEAQRSGGRVHYEVDGFDVHVLNPAFRVACPDHLLSPQPPSGPAADSRARAAEALKASLLVQVSGSVQYGAGKEAPRGSFAEVFVLVPNWDSMGPKAPRGAKGWLIMSQNYRAL